MSQLTEPEQGDAALFHHCRSLKGHALDMHPRDVRCTPEEGGCGARPGDRCRLEPRPQELSDVCTLLEVTAPSLPLPFLCCQVRRDVWQAKVDNLEWWASHNGSGAKPHSSATEAHGPIGIECPEHHVPADTPCPGPSAPSPDSEAPVDRNPVAALISQVEARISGPTRDCNKCGADMILDEKLRAFHCIGCGRETDDTDADARELLKALRASVEALDKAEASMALMTAQARAWARGLPPPATVAERYSEHELVKAPVRDALKERDEQHGFASQVLTRRADDWTARAFLAMAAAQQERDIRTAVEQELSAARTTLAAYQALFGGIDVFTAPMCVALVSVATATEWAPVDDDPYQRQSRRWYSTKDDIYKRAGEVWRLPSPHEGGWMWNAYSPLDGAALGSDLDKDGPGKQDTAEKAQACVDAALKAFCRRKR